MYMNKGVSFYRLFVTYMHTAAPITSMTVMAVMGSVMTGIRIA